MVVDDEHGDRMDTNYTPVRIKAFAAVVMCGCISAISLWLGARYYNVFMLQAQDYKPALDLATEAFKALCTQYNGTAPRIPYQNGFEEQCCQSEPACISQVSTYDDFKNAYYNYQTALNTAGLILAGSIAVSGMVILGLLLIMARNSNTLRRAFGFELDTPIEDFTPRRATGPKIYIRRDYGTRDLTPIPVSPVDKFFASEDEEDADLAQLPVLHDRRLFKNPNGK